MIPPALSRDMPRDNPGGVMDGQWLSYAEAAVRLGITPESARRRARRGNWARQPGNDGRTRVLVPALCPPDVPPEVPPDVLPDVPPLVSALNDHIATLKAENENLRKHVETLQAALAKAEAAAVKADAAAERGHLAEIEAAAVPALRDTVAALKAALDSEQARNRELRRARDAGGPLYRVLRWMRKAG
jgi:hypothetical protein